MLAVEIGEPWVYTNWDSGEPNNTYFGGWGKEATGQSEGVLQYHHGGTQWNDLPDDPEVVTDRFIIERDIPQVQDADGDGIPDNQDKCQNSDLSPTVVIDHRDSGVPNTLISGGCTISDLIIVSADGVSNHGQFVSRVAQLLNHLHKTGIITGQQKDALRFAHWPLRDVTAGFALRSLAVADVNGDGELDIVTADELFDEVSVLLRQ
jgi:hypothetical protein